MTLIGHLQARVAGVGPGGGGCVYEAGLFRVRSLDQCPVSFTQQTRGSGLSHPLPLLWGNCLAGVVVVAATAWP